MIHLAIASKLSVMKQRRFNISYQHDDSLSQEINAKNVTHDEDDPVGENTLTSRRVT